MEDHGRPPPTGSTTKGRRFPPEPLTELEVEALAHAANPRYASGARARALVLVLAGSGCRIAEALHARPKDLDADRGTLRLLRTKGGGYRVVPVTGAAMTALARWMEHREKLGIPSSAPLFCSREGKPLASAYVRALLPRLARRAGVQKRVHAHGLRHTFALEQDRRGMRTTSIAKLLGHRHTSTTDTYLAHLSNDDAIADWRAAQERGASR